MCLCAFRDKLDRAEVVRSASAGCGERDRRCHGVTVQQDAESTERPQLEGRKEHDG